MVIIAVSLTELAKVICVFIKITNCQKNIIKFGAKSERLLKKNLTVSLNIMTNI